MVCTVEVTGTEMAEIRVAAISPEMTEMGLAAVETVWLAAPADRRAVRAELTEGVAARVVTEELSTAVTLEGMATDSPGVRAHRMAAQRAAAEAAPAAVLLRR